MSEHRTGDSTGLSTTDKIVLAIAAVACMIIALVAVTTQPWTWITEPPLTPEEELAKECGSDLVTLPDADTTRESAPADAQRFAGMIVANTPDLAAGLTPYGESGISTGYDGRMPRVSAEAPGWRLRRSFFEGEEVICGKYVLLSPQKGLPERHLGWDNSTVGFDRERLIPHEPLGYFLVDAESELALGYPYDNPPDGVYAVHDGFFKEPLAVTLSQDTHALTITNPHPYVAQVAVWRKDPPS